MCDAPCQVSTVHSCVIFVTNFITHIASVTISFHSFISVILRTAFIDEVEHDDGQFHIRETLAQHCALTVSLNFILIHQSCNVHRYATVNNTSYLTFDFCFIITMRNFQFRRPPQCHHQILVYVKIHPLFHTRLRHRIACRYPTRHCSHG